VDRGVPGGRASFTFLWAGGVPPILLLAAETDFSLRELDQRESDGMVVTLLWHEPTNGLMVCVSDERTGSYFELEARADNALEVFHHPYAHAA
jgi:hypothetical protein